MKRSRWIPFAVVAVALTAAVLLSADSQEPAATTGAPLAARSVQVAAVTAATVSRTVRLSGVTQASHREHASFPHGGRMASREVEVGERVTAGQVLARLDPAPLTHAVAAAEAALAELDSNRAQAERDRDRSQRLLAAKAATAEELEQTSARLAALDAAREAATARLAEARRGRGDAVLRAGSAGVVTAVFLQAGEYAAAGAPVVALAYEGPVEVVVEVPEALLPAVHEGDELPVSLPLAGTRARGVVLSVASAAGAGAGLFPVRLRLAAVAPDRTAGPPAARGILPGMTAEVELTSAPERTLSVPVRAILNPGGSRPSLFRVRGGHAERLAVELGALVGDRVTVTGGAGYDTATGDGGPAIAALAIDDRVVVAGHTRLSDGEAVEVLP
jgi:RND family efflux transporter MFP subunit